MEVDNPAPPPRLVEIFDGKVVADEASAKNIVEGMNRNVKAAVLNLLSHHAPQAYGKKASAKDLIAWLQRPNCERSYLLYKISGLKDLMSTRSIQLQHGKKKNTNNIIEALGAFDKNNNGVEADNAALEFLLDPKNAATKEIMKRSYLPQQKGEKREHCSLGHKLEKPIVQKWINLMHGNGVDDSPDPEIKKVLGVYTAGLAAKKNAEYAKDSIDFIVVVELADSSTQTWGFEAKGRVTTTTADEEQEHLNHLNYIAEPHIRIFDDEVFEEVADVGERFQILQHSFVYSFESVVLAIADSQAELIRSLIVDFSPQLRQNFGKVLKDIKDFALSWAYPEDEEQEEQEEEGAPRRRRNRRNKIHRMEIPDDVFKIGDTVPEINGREVLQGTANLWLAMVKTTKPFPTFARIIPAMYAYWNAVKGGSDTGTKLMDDCILRIPKAHLNPETVAMNRLMFLVFVSCHRLSQVFSAKEDLSQYDSLFHYRKAASDRSTYQCTLLKSYHFFERQLENTTILTPPARKRRRHQPTRRRVSGLPTEDMDESGISIELSICTPVGITAKVRRGTAPQDVEDMVKNCRGIPVKQWPAQNGMRCAKCGNKTSWYCAGCKRWFCMERRKLGEDSIPNGIYTRLIKNKRKDFQKMCFHEAHEHNWYREGADATNAISINL